jgi:hypothetical protein
MSSPAGHECHMTGNVANNQARPQGLLVAALLPQLGQLKAAGG